MFLVELLPTFQKKLIPFSSGPNQLFGLLTLEDGKDGLSRNVGKELPQYSARCPRRVNISRSTKFIFTNAFNTWTEINLFLPMQRNVDMLITLQRNGMLRHVS